MKRAFFTDMQPEYRYFPVKDNYADIFIYRFIEKTVQERHSNSDDDAVTTEVYVYDINELHVPQSEVTEDMVKSDPLKFLDYTPALEEKTEDLILEVLAEHEEQICLMQLGIEEESL